MKRNKALFLISLIIAVSAAADVSTPLSASVDSSFTKTTVALKLDIRKYFEEAMYLFETGKYKEAVLLFEKLIEVEKAGNELYFTPFAEIYIEKSRARMAELMIMEEKKWERVKKDVVDEAEAIARKEIEGKKRTASDSRKKETVSKEQAAESVFEDAVRYFKTGNYPEAMVEFKRVKNMDSSGRLSGQADSYINKMRQEMKKSEEKILLVRMEEAKRARIEVEKETERRKLELARKEKEKEAFKRLFDRRLRVREYTDRVRKVALLTDNIINNIRGSRFDEAEALVNQAIQEFPGSEKFKELLHYIEMKKIKLEEAALKRAKELTEEKMMLDVAKEHLLPEEKTAGLETEKKITPIVKVPEIRKRLKIPISIDFKDVGLDYVLGFLSETTGVNIVPSSGIDMEEKKVTIKIRDMPLEEALRYILKSQDLIYRIEEDAVWVATKEEIANEKIDTRVYFLNQGIGRFAEFSVQPDSSLGESESGSESSETPAEVKTVKNILENSVDWPKDSKLTLDERTGALIISNTPSNLETIENLLFNLDITPIQVLIEAKFLEVRVSDLDDIGIEWKLNSMWGMDRTRTGDNVYGVSKDSGSNFSDFSRQDEGFNLTYKGLLTNPQFQAVLHALQEKQNVKTLSAPRITTLNNQTATIEVIDEYIYPTRYEASLVQYDINGDGDFDDAGETEWVNVPQDFVTRNVGILLHVKPCVGSDKESITLALTPEVSEDAGTYTYSGNVNIPKFTTRNLSTSVMVKNGETIVMGGLIKETNTNVKTKVPILGNIPVLGVLFKKNTDSKERRNLLIFVTASIMDKEQDKVALKE
ncbi:MAG: secretin N-terminal domain-containing protein [Candidatus Omnitrophota bacterium]|jgi:Flp pilus assembly secretin CpaC/tetratricopeptide (TPR) repeat protein